jgi:hypothetical protein
MKGMVCPDQINKTSLLCYDEWNEEIFESLPDFLKDKIKRSTEYFTMRKITSVSQEPESENENVSQESEPPF